MHEAMCPFCLGENIKFIDFVRVDGLENSRPLMECNECEKFFWNDDGKEIKHLSESCATLLMSPEKCYEEVRIASMAGIINYDKRKTEEFDLLCGSCSHRKFFLKV
jgi:hypothetical protein